MLLTVVGLPHGLPAAAQLRGYLTRPDDGTVFIAAAAAVAWAGWAVFALSTAAEAVTALGGRCWRPPGLGGVQRPAAQLVSAVVVLLAGAAVPNLAGPGARPAAAAVLTAPPPSPTAPTPDATGPVPDQPARAVPAEPVLPPAGRWIVVQPRDTLWALAERHCGDPLGWRELAAANYGRPQPDGGHLTDAHWIYPGWRLRLPESWANPAHPPAVRHARPAPRTPPRPVPHPARTDPAPAPDHPAGAHCGTVWPARRRGPRHPPGEPARQARPAGDDQPAGRGRRRGLGGRAHRRRAARRRAAAGAAPPTPPAAAAPPNG